MKIAIGEAQVPHPSKIRPMRPIGVLIFSLTFLLPCFYKKRLYFAVVVLLLSLLLFIFYYYYYSSWCSVVTFLTDDRRLLQKVLLEGMTLGNSSNLSFLPNIRKLVANNSNY